MQYNYLALTEVEILLRDFLIWRPQGAHVVLPVVRRARRPIVLGRGQVWVSARDQPHYITILFIDINIYLSPYLLYVLYHSYCKV